MSAPQAPGGAGPAGPASPPPPPGPPAPPPTPASTPASTPDPEDRTPPSKGDSTPNQGTDGSETGRQSGDFRSRPGAGTSRNEHARAAARNLIDGDIVAGDKFVYLLGGERKRLSRLSPILAKQAHHAFVEPKGWDDLRERFATQRTAILRGSVGQGRVTTAIRLLRTTSTEVVYHLDPRVDLGRLAEWIEADRQGAERIETGAAFLLSQPKEVAQLHGWVFHALEDALERADARLVLTVGVEDRLAENDLLGYLIDLPPAPGHRQIFERHLRWRLTDNTAEQVLAQAEVQSLVEELLGGEASCDSAAVLALTISQQAGEGAVNVERVRQLMARRSTDEFDIWFDGLRDVETRTFAIALAVLNGLPYEEVVQAAGKLRRKLGTTPQLGTSSQPPPRSRGRNPLQAGNARRLEELQAGTTEITARRFYGWTPVTAVAFKDAAYPKNVLESAWRNYDIQSNLLDWLGELVVDPSEQVRVFAGFTLGMLSTYAFDYLYHEVFEPWANVETPSPTADLRRDAVAYALRVAADDPQLRPSVVNLVSGWYGNLNRPLAQATAARAHGLSLGRLDHTAALAALDRLAMIDNAHVAVAIGESLADLLVDGAGRVAPDLFAVLLRWLDDRKRTFTGQWAFLILADSLVSEVTVEGGGNRPARWPTLLDLAREHSGLREPLFALWRRALNTAFLHNGAKLVMTGWARMAEADGGLLDAFTRMVRAIASPDPRTGLILSRLANEWVSEDNLQPLPRAAKAVASVVGR